MTTFQFPHSTLAEGLYHNQDFHDVVLVYKHHDFPVHRAVVSLFSRYLSQMFVLPFSDRLLYRVDLDDLPVDVRLFRQFLDSLYCQPLSITKENAFDLYYIAEFFKVEQIKSNTFSFIQNLSPPDLCHVIARADDCFHTTFIKECCPLLDKQTLVEPLPLKEETFWTLSKFLKTSCSIKWLLTSLVKSFIDCCIEVSDVETVFRNSINLIKEIDLDFIWKEVVQNLEKYEEMTRVLLDFCFSMIPINSNPNTSSCANMTSSYGCNTNIRNDFLFWMLITANRLESNQIDRLVKEIPAVFDLGQRDSAHFTPSTLIKLCSQLKSIDHVMWLIKSFVESFVKSSDFSPEQVKNVLSLLEVKDIPLNFVYFELFVPLKSFNSLSLVLIEFSINCFNLIQVINSNSNWLVETIQLVDNNDFNLDDLGSFLPKFKVINASPIPIKAKTFIKLKGDASNHFETDYWLLQSLVTSYKKLSNHNQSDSDWSVEIFRECLYLFDFENFTFADLNQILAIPLKSCTELYSVMFPFHIDIIVPKGYYEFTEISFKRMKIQLREEEISRVLSSKFCQVFQFKMIGNVIDLRETSLSVDLIDASINDDFTNVSKFIPFINAIHDEDFQKDLLGLFLQMANEFTIKEFEKVVAFADSINCEDRSILSRVQITAAESINLSAFDRLLNLSIKYQNFSLFNSVISLFNFTSKPKVFGIPQNLLFGLKQQEFMNQNKDIWLKHVLKNSCNSNSTELDTITTQLFGQSILFEELPTPPLRICLWAHNLQLNDTTRKIQKGFRQNWPNIEVEITSDYRPSLNNINNFDVFMHNSSHCSIQGRLLEQIVEAGKGLVLFSCDGYNIGGDFKYGAFKGLRRWKDLESYTNLGNSNQNDLIMKSVNSFSCKVVAEYTSINPEFQTVVSLENGDPLVLKSEYNKSRVVDFYSNGHSNDCPLSFSSGWQSSSDGHLLLANSIVWASGRDE
ncbi:hypothetical protein P9112_006941 [Eukaryota sp. TZLM1-RC]